MQLRGINMVCAALGLVALSGCADDPTSPFEVESVRIESTTCGLYSIYNNRSDEIFWDIVVPGAGFDFEWAPCVDPDTCFRGPIPPGGEVHGQFELDVTLFDPDNATHELRWWRLLQATGKSFEVDRVRVIPFDIKPCNWETA